LKAVAAIVYGVMGLTWAGISPGTATAGTGYSGVITGTGFLASGIDLMKADDGLGDIINANGPYVQNDTTINVGFDSIGLSPAATYTIYYSTDHGTTWTTTGLTVVSSNP
jgi:hypothetical protein